MNSSGRYKGVHAFPWGISLKVNIIVQLEFDLAYYDVPSNMLVTTLRGIPPL